MGGSCHIVHQPTENVVNRSSQSDLEDLYIPPALEKLDRKLIFHSDSEHLQSLTEIRNFNIPPSELKIVREREEGVARNLA